MSGSDGDEDLNNLDPGSLAAALDSERPVVIDDTLDHDMHDTFSAGGGDIEMVQIVGRKPEPDRACSNESGDENDNAEEAIIVKVKGKKARSQRDSAFAKELPRVAPIIVPEATRPPKTKNEPRVWTAVSQLVLPIGSKKLPLLKQSDEVQLVIQGAIDNTEASFLMDDPFPTSKHKVEIARQGLLMSAEDVAKKFQDVQEIADRLRADLSFATPLGELVLDRVTTNRSLFFKKAAVPAIAYYQLGTDEVFRVRYKVLCSSGRPRYVFVGKLGLNTKGDETYKIMVTKPYLNPAIIATAKYFFANPKSIGNRLFPRFKSSLKDAPQEREMPATIIALVATAVFAALHRWCD